MKFTQDNGIPELIFGGIAMFIDAPVKIVRLCDNFVQYRKNKPKKGSEF